MIWAIVQAVMRDDMRDNFRSFFLIIDIFLIGDNQSRILRISETSIDMGIYFFLNSAQDCL